MNSTLTAARAALYWGAKVQLSNEISRMACISETQILTDIDWRSISDCKIILRTVEQLTDDEKQNIVKLLNLDTYDYYITVGTYKVNNLTILNMSYRGLPCRRIAIDGTLQKSISDYLRKQKVDIDNAIADGWAVKQEEVSNE